MKQALAVVVAIALIGGAYYLGTQVLAPDGGAPVTDGTAAPDGPGAPAGRVACDALLGSRCPAGADQLDADDIIAAFAEQTVAYEVLVAPQAVVDMVVGSQRSTVAFAADPAVVGTTPLVLAVAGSRAGDLAGCGATVTWSCASRLVTAGTLRPALHDPATDADGILALAALAGGYFDEAGLPFNANGFSTGGFVGWLDAVGREAVVSSAPVDNLIRFGGAQNDSAVVTEAEALRAVGRAAQNVPVLVHPEPLAVVPVVVAVVEGRDADIDDLVDDLTEGLAADGWRAPDGEPLDTPDGVDAGPPVTGDDGLPSGGVLVALQSRWSQ